MTTAPTSGHAQQPSVRPAVPGAPAGVTAITNVDVVPMDTERVLSNQTVLVKDGWITALGPSGQVAPPAGAARIDGRGRYLIPGLADCHTHLIAYDDADDATLEQHMVVFVAAGVTTIRNMDYRGSEDFDARVLRLRARAAAGEIVSPRIYTSGRWRTLLEGDVAPSDYGKTDRLEDIRSQVEAYKASGYDFIKVQGFDSAAVFDSLMAAAREVGIPVVGHVPAGVSVREALAAGMRSLEHTLGYYPPPPSAPMRQKLEPSVPLDSMIALTKRAGAWNCLTNFWGRAARVPVTTALHKAGAKLLLGTDGAPDVYPRRYLHRPSMHLDQLVRVAGLTPYEALVLGTRNMAQYLGTLDSMGTVAVGKRADLVLLSGNPLQNVKAVRRPVGVMLGGRWFPQDELYRRIKVLEPRAWIPE